ncbi:unnamed protein product [Echinostoma caproni]|uniref:Kinetochore protein Spc24 n=1 Tax=Echinostoma caproni TaxID=27848 RepID=A0A183AHA8_9TREM|nr:unnamed protein product [Echinostoma caproni]
MDRIHRTLQFEQDEQIRTAVWSVHQLAQTRLTSLARRYEASVDSVRAACRTQLANTISILRGLLAEQRKRDDSETKQQLEQRVIQLKEELEKKMFDIRLLRQQVEQVQAERDEALSLVSWAPHNYPTAWVQTDSTVRACRNVAVQAGKPIQEEDLEAKLALERLVSDLRSHNETLRSRVIFFPGNVQFNHQRNGVEMGSSLEPLFVDVFMSKL